jgi:hypothetical protein
MYGVLDAAHTQLSTSGDEQVSGQPAHRLTRRARPCSPDDGDSRQAPQRSGTCGSGIDEGEPEFGPAGLAKFARRLADDELKRRPDIRMHEVTAAHLPSATGMTIDDILRSRRRLRRGTDIPRDDCDLISVA